MPGSTSRGYPYPLGSEQALGATDIQSLATAMDTDVGGAIRTTGDTMTGPLTLSADPASPLQAMTKQYMDDGRGWGTFNSTAIATGVAVPLSLGPSYAVDGLTVGTTTLTITRPGWWAFSLYVDMLNLVLASTTRSFITIHVTNDVPGVTTAHPFRGTLGPGERWAGVSALATMKNGHSVKFDAYHNSGAANITATGSWSAKWVGAL